MALIPEFLNPALDPSQIQDSTFEALHYVNTLKINLIMQVILIVIPFLIWLFYGFGTGGTRKMRLARPNYYFFLLLLLFQIIIIILYDFPIFIKLFD